MATTYKVLGQLASTNSAVSIYTCPSDTQTIVSSTPCSENGGFDINAGNNITGEGFTIHISFTGDTYIGVVSYW